MRSAVVKRDMVNASNVSNSTADRPTTEPGFQWSYVQTAETIIATTGTISSLVVIVVMAARPSLRKQLTYQLTICLAVADCVSCVFLVPRTLRGSFAIPHGIAGEIYCRTIKATVLWVSFVASTYSLLVITVERYLAVVHPLWFKTRKSKISLPPLVAAIWLLAFTTQTFCVYNNSYDDQRGVCRYEWPLGEWYQTFVGIGLFFATYFIPLVLLLLAYGRMISVIRSKMRHVGFGIPPAYSSGRVAIKAKHKVVKMYLIVCLAFCVCWAPNQLLFLIANFGYRINYNGGLYNSTRVLAAVNSCLNPFIYAVWSRPFRQGVKAVFCRRRKTWNTDHSYVSNISSSVRSTMA